MADPRTALVQAWLAKSEEDLAVARLLIAEERRLLGAGVYHCQQAAEKSLKAWLTAHDLVFPKTHDLEIMVQLSATVRPGFLSLLGEAQRLTPLATEYRYPGDAHAPEPETAQALLQAAEEIHRVVIASLASKGPNPTAKE